MKIFLSYFTCYSFTIIVIKELLLDFHDSSFFLYSHYFFLSFWLWTWAIKAICETVTGTWQNHLLLCLSFDLLARCSFHISEGDYVSLFIIADTE